MILNSSLAINHVKLTFTYLLKVHILQFIPDSLLKNIFENKQKANLNYCYTSTMSETFSSYIYMKKL